MNITVSFEQNKDLSRKTLFRGLQKDAESVIPIVDNPDIEADLPPELEEILREFGLLEEDEEESTSDTEDE